MGFEWGEFLAAGAEEGVGSFLKAKERKRQSDLEASRQERQSKMDELTRRKTLAQIAHLEKADEPDQTYGTVGELIPKQEQVGMTPSYLGAPVYETSQVHKLGQFRAPISEEPEEDKPVLLKLSEGDKKKFNAGFEGMTEMDHLQTLFTEYKLDQPQEILSGIALDLPFVGETTMARRVLRKQAQFNTARKKGIQAYGKFISGVAMSEKEYKRIESTYPALGEDKVLFQATLNNFKRQIQSGYRGMIEQIRITQGDEQAEMLQAKLEEKGVFRHIEKIRMSPEQQSQADAVVADITESAMRAAEEALGKKEGKAPVGGGPNESKRRRLEKLLEKATPEQRRKLLGGG